MKVKEIETINFGETSVKVEDASDTVKGLVYHYNNANQRDQDLTDELVIIRTAKDSILAQIRLQLEKEAEEALNPPEAAANDQSIDPSTVVPPAAADSPTVN